MIAKIKTLAFAIALAMFVMPIAFTVPSVKAQEGGLIPVESTGGVALDVESMISSGVSAIDAIFGLVTETENFNMFCRNIANALAVFTNTAFFHMKNALKVAMYAAFIAVFVPLLPACVSFVIVFAIVFGIGLLISIAEGLAALTRTSGMGIW